MKRVSKKPKVWVPGPAPEIIAKFGGTRACAKLLERKPSTVQSWKESGHIPAREQLHVLTVAKANGIELSPADFFLEGAAA